MSTLLHEITALASPHNSERARLGPLELDHKKKTLAAYEKMLTDAYLLNPPRQDCVLGMEMAVAMAKMEEWGNALEIATLVRTYLGEAFLGRTPLDDSSKQVLQFTRMPVVVGDNNAEGERHQLVLLARLEEEIFLGLGYWAKIFQETQSRRERVSADCNGDLNDHGDRLVALLAQGRFRHLSQRLPFMEVRYSEFQIYGMANMCLDDTDWVDDGKFGCSYWHSVAKRVFEKIVKCQGHDIAVAEPRCWSISCRQRASESHKLLTCKGCQIVQFCGKECQVTSWHLQGHKHECATLKPFLPYVSS